MSTETDDKMNRNGAEKIRTYLTFGLLLIAAWVLWSGMFKPLLLGLGALSCTLASIIAIRMGYFDTRVFALRVNFRLFRFWIWLFGEIFRSSLEVARVVLSRKPKLCTRVVEIDASQLSAVDQVLLGNSITLTPGTLTLDITECRLKVHALTAEGARSLEQGDMLRRVSAIHED